MTTALTTFSPRLLAAGALLVLLLLGNIVVRDRSTRALYRARLGGHAHARGHQRARTRAEPCRRRGDRRTRVSDHRPRQLSRALRRVAGRARQRGRPAGDAGRRPPGTGGRRGRVARLAGREAGQLHETIDTLPGPGPAGSRRAHHDRAKQGRDGRHPPPDPGHAIAGGTAPQDTGSRVREPHTSAPPGRAWPRVCSAC